jgi:hypothetical protein
MLARKKLVRSVAATAAVAAALACLAGPAQAYDRGTCEAEPGTATIVDDDRVSINGGKVDFGDILHLGGAPAGTAVVCWKADGGVRVRGRLFADSNSALITAQVEVGAIRTSGTVSTMAYDFKGLYAENRVVDFGWDYGTFNHIRIRLYKWEPSATARERVANIVVSRGD